MKKAVVAWGRMNPPTVGHEKLVNRVIAVAKRELGEPRIYLSHTQNPKKDPLSYRDKIRMASLAFGNVVKSSTSRTIIDLMKELERNGYKQVVLVAGSDRVKEFSALLNKYNGKDFSFESIKVVSAGERDPDADGAEGMSATKMRVAAAMGDEKSFHSGAPSGLSKRDKTALYNLVRKGMLVEEIEMFLEKAKKKIDIDHTDFTDDELKKAVDEIKEEIEIEEDVEQIDERAPLTIQQRMRRSRQMKRLAPKMKRLRQIKKFRLAPLERLQARARKTAKNLLRKKFAGEKGGRYASLSASEKITIDRLVANKSAVIEKLAKRLLPIIRKKEVERIRQARNTRKEEVEYFVESHNVQKSFNNLFSEQDAVRAARETIKKEKEQDKLKHDAMLDRARLRDTQTANRKEEFKLTEKSRAALQTKAKKSGHSFDTIKEVYLQGVAIWMQNPRASVTAEQWGYAKVNTFIANEGLKDPKDNPCWDGYKPVGTKKKNGKVVPNCVPEDKAQGEYKENFMDGKGPGKPGDAARHGLKGKSPSELRKIRSSDSASPRKKQLAHWLLNFVHKEQVEEDTGSFKHHVFQPTLKHGIKHAQIHKDIDADGDVDALDKLLPDEVTAAETDRKRIQNLMKHRGEMEKKHTKKGHAFESTNLSESLRIEKGAGYGTFLTAADYGMKLQGAFDYHPSVVDEEGGAGEEGTSKLKDKYKKETPGQ